MVLIQSGARQITKQTIEAELATLLEKCGNLKTPAHKRAAVRTCSGPTFSSNILPTGIGVIIGFTPEGKKQRVAIAAAYGERMDSLAKMLLDLK